MKTAILSIVALLFAYTGMSQSTSGSSSVSGRQHHATQSQTHRKYKGERNSSTTGKKHRSATGTYHSYTSDISGRHKARSEKTWRNKSNAAENSSRETEDSTRK